jgi:hypothetical protein
MLVALIKASDQSLTKHVVASARREWGGMLFPREHGAYGQMAFPLVTALIVSAPSPSGFLLIVAVIAGFLAHEPVTILLGSRGPRARRELNGTATRQLGACLFIGAIAVVGAMVTMEAPVRWLLIGPGVPALCVAIATLSRYDKSSWSEVAAALAFSAAAVPVATAGGASVRAALSVAIPFALLFVASTLAVRVVILGVRGGGDPRAVLVTKRTVLLFAVFSAVSLGAVTAAECLPAVVAIAAAPGIATAVAIAARPPSPTRLRTLGWTLIAVSVITAGILAGTL